jgi:hypothetical protein
MSTVDGLVLAKSTSLNPEVMPISHAAVLNLAVSWLDQHCTGDPILARIDSI